MAFIQDITAIIDEVNYEDPRRLKEALQSYNHKKKDGCYIVKETYEHLEKLVDALQSLRHQSISIIIDEGNYEDPRRLKEILQSYKHKKKDGFYRVKGTFEQLENLVDILRSPRHQSISIIIDEGNYEDPERLKEILQSYKHEKKDGCYRVKGTFEHLEKLIDALRSPRHRSSSATHGETFQQDNHVSTHAKHLDVSGVVMDYINQKCADKLKKIQGTKFLIKIQPVHSQSNSLVRVTFKPQCDSFYPSARLHGDFVRQQFITFYQRTASDLQVTPVHLSSHECVNLQRKFPHLLFKPSNGNYQQTAMGPFAQIAKLNEFLSQNIQTSSKSPVNKVFADTPGSRTLGLSPTCSKDLEEETCPICMDSILAKDKKTLRCKHSFCKDCLKRAFDYKPVCPTCGEVYGTLIGTQPDGGKMTVTHDSSSLLGYEKYGTIIIDYHIPSGIQKEEHPNPGQPYVGVSRRAYIPDSSEGRMILQLLRRAFDQRLIFTIGRSTTSGRNNMVTWNDIHHKTSTQGGPTHYGYPDPDYLNRVRDELKVKGIE